MKWMKNIWLRIINWWNGNEEEPKKIYQLLQVNEQPLLVEVADNLVYHIGDEDWKWLLMFKCPCGCGNVIHLSLLEKSVQKWKLKVEDNNIFSIQPSVNRQVGCKSHFFITHNEVKWCEQLEL